MKNSLRLEGPPIWILISLKLSKEEETCHLSLLIVCFYGHKLNESDLWFR